VSGVVDSVDAKLGDTFHELLVRETVDRDGKMAEADDRAENSHHPWVPEAHARGVETAVIGRSGHPVEGGHIGGR
jgi:hypothetical protein